MIQLGGFKAWEVKGIHTHQQLQNTSLSLHTGLIIIDVGSESDVRARDVRILVSENTKSEIISSHRGSSAVKASYGTVLGFELGSIEPLESPLRVGLGTAGSKGDSSKSDLFLK